MKKLIKRLVCLLLMVSFVFGMVAVAPVRIIDAGTYDKAAIFRIAGTDRFDTANKIAMQGWSGSYCSRVFLASADSYADALAGVPLAHENNAPILLVRGKSVPQSVMDTIYELGVTSITILGGTAAVSQEIEDELENKGFGVYRIAGKNRYETAWQIALDILVDSRHTSSEIFVVSGENYPDALSVGPIAALKGAPIIYSNKQGAKYYEDLYALEYALEDDSCDHTYRFSGELGDSDWAEDELKEGGWIPLYLRDKVDKVTIVGGEAAVGKKIVDNIKASGIKNIDRVYGASRYETSLMVTERFSDVFKTKELAFATGENYPDALAGGVFAAKKGMPILLLNPKSEASQSSYIGINAIAYDSSRDYSENLVEFINTFKPEKVYALGGENVIPDRVLDSYFEGDFSAFKTVNCSVSLVDVFKDTDFSKVSISIYSGTLTPCEKNEADITISNSEYRYFKVENGTGELVYTPVADKNGVCSVKLPEGEYTVIANCTSFSTGALDYYRDLYNNKFNYKWSEMKHVKVTTGMLSAAAFTLGTVTPR